MTFQRPGDVFKAGADRAGYVRGMFGAIAARYDLMNSLMTGGRHHAWRRLAARELVRPGNLVVDAGCGTGDLALACLEAGAGSVLGVDFALPMLAHARDKARHREAGGASFALADATRLPVADRSVDAWCSAFMVRNVPDLDAALGEAHRVLRPGGRLAVLEIPRLEGGLLRPLIRLHFSRLVPLIGRLVSGHESAYAYLPVSVDHFLTPQQFSQALRQAGFEVRSVRLLMLGTVALHVAEKPARAQRYDHRPMSAEVIALGAWCDLVPPEEDTATPGGASFRVHEFAMLADSRRVTIRDDLGFSSWSRSYHYDAGETQRLDPWLSLTRENVEREVRNVVLPDDDDSEDEHPYAWLQELLLRQGIETSVEQLRSVPYTVEFSGRLERRLLDKRPSDGE